MAARIFAVGFAFMGGNYAYQLMESTPDWSAANERTFFQAAMLAFILLTLPRHDEKDVST